MKFDNDILVPELIAGFSAAWLRRRLEKAKTRAPLHSVYQVSACLKDGDLCRPFEAICDCFLEPLCRELCEQVVLHPRPLEDFSDRTSGTQTCTIQTGVHNVSVAMSYDSYVAGIRVVLQYKRIG